MDLDDEYLPVAKDGEWHHATVSFPTGRGPTPQAATALLAGLAGRRFWFLRKNGQLRLRTTAPIDAILDQLVTDRLASGWVAGIYEPEAAAFGGPEGMAVSHELFCADSPGALAATGRAGSRERCVLLLSALTRGAGLDRFETGDVWARLGAERPQLELSQLPSGQQRTAAVTAVRRLMNVDAAKAPDENPTWPDRVAAFEGAGRQLALLAAEGRLTRGLRAVLAHHAIFTLNRGAIDTADQAALAWLAQQVVFSDDQAAVVSTRRLSASTPKVGQMETTLSPTADPDALRTALVTKLTDSQWLRTPAIIDAFRQVPRHLFVSDVDVETAYRDDAVSVKTDEAGEMISCISQPTVIATQLEQLDVRPGHKVFEAGAATGYNAALLAHLAGPGGHVWTVDVDEDLVDQARQNLAAAEVANVTVELADGAAGLPEHGPFDRIQFTVGTADIPAPILNQLAPGGRLVIPMRVRGSISRSFAFERDGETWRAVSTEMATFVPLRKGSMDDNRDMPAFDGPGDVRIEIYPEQDVDFDALRTVLETPATKLYSGVKFRAGGAFEWLYLWLACALPNGLSRMPGKRPGFTPHFSWGSMAALSKDSLAYLTMREGADEDGDYWEIGVIGHGPVGDVLAEQVTEEIRAWDRHGGNGSASPTFRMASGPARNTLATGASRFVIDKPTSRLAVDWP
ncbi:methyltransferase, FxLD system [Actinospica robiniae]|uniref:methyltransferase, FxLD system n=1 Tax=Actinospica robiniae TaxID=304901 RepID=UPI00041C40C9|nr:methyltransferase, FxLD system [Actinospica robiniae]